MWTPSRIFAIAWLCTFVPVDVVAYWMFFERKNEHPIKGSKPVIVLGQDFLMICWNVMLCVRMFTDQSLLCLAQLWLWMLPLIFIYSLYILRGLILYYDYVRTARIVKFTPTNVSDEFLRKMEQTPLHLVMKRQNSIALRKGQQIRYYDSLRIWSKDELAKLLFVLSILMVIPMLIASVGDRSLLEQTGRTCNFGWIGTVFSIYLGFAALCLISISLMMRSFNDDFAATKQELRLTSLVTVICAILYYIFSSVLDQTQFPYSNVPLLLMIQAGFGISTVLPIFRMLKRRPQIADEDIDGYDKIDNARQLPKNMKNLEAILDSQLGRSVFKTYLETEFSVENLLFYLDVKGFKAYCKECGYVLNKGDKKETADDSRVDYRLRRNSSGIDITTLGRIMRRARHIHRTYFNPDSITQINVPSDVKEIVCRTLVVEDVRHGGNQLGLLNRKADKNSLGLGTKWRYLTGARNKPKENQPKRDSELLKCFEETADTELREMSESKNAVKSEDSTSQSAKQESELAGSTTSSDQASDVVTQEESEQNVDIENKQEPSIQKSSVSSDELSTKTSDPPNPITSTESESGVISPRNIRARHNTIDFANLYRQGQHVTPQELTKLVTVFDDAQRMVLDLMRADSFPRFKQSQIYTEFVAKIQKAKRRKRWSIIDIKLV